MTPHKPLRLAAPRISMFFVLLTIVLAITLPLFTRHQNTAGTVLSWYLSFVWSMPILATVLALVGASKARVDLFALHERPGDRMLCPNKLIVQIPTIGRHDVLPALERVVRSFERAMPEYFADWRVDIVSEERCEAREELMALRSHHVRVIFVPSDYQTPNGTQRKARANCYMDELRVSENEIDNDTWILHMDDDTGVSDDTASELAIVVCRNRFHRRAKHMAQGVLTYPRQFATSYWTWMADAVRPSSDMTIFRLMTGGGYPLVGAHGELLLVRSSVEHEIGWDFGRHLSITEDANFALTFAKLFPKASTWFAARSFGASPATMKELVMQRKRWSRGLLHVVCNGSLPLRYRLLLGYAMSSWIIGPLQHIAFIVGVGLILGTTNTSPVLQVLVAIWGCNLSLQIWTYIEGLRHNLHASGIDRPSVRHRLSLLLIPYFSLIEGWAGLRGALEFIKDRRGTHKGELFEVISKPT